MAFEPQRFIHAANVRLDVPVSVHTSETLTDELRFAFEDATLNAFDEVVQSCVRHNVDFLLLSGNIFIESDRSLRARLALLKGCRTLDEHGIQIYVLPGDSDPPEAWRAIPELPDNVTVCVSSNPEPAELLADDRVITTVSSSMWYGEADDFGIRVLAVNQDGVQPFRIGLISRAKFEEAQRMAAMKASPSDETLTASMQHVASGERIESADEGADANEDSRRVWHALDSEDGQQPQRLASSVRRSVQRPLESLDAAPNAEHPSLDPEFIAFVDEMLRECRLNYLALTGELTRATLWRDDGVVHCPGTTQPRSHQESAGGSCSLIEVSETGEVQITPVDTSCVDWKQLTFDVGAQSNLSTILQQMKMRLLDLKAGASDRFWSVQWTLRGTLAALRQLSQNDLEVALAVELDELQFGSRTVRLLHEIRPLPHAWPYGDPPTSLADQYQALTTSPRRLTDSSLLAVVDAHETLTAGWKQRLTSLLPALDPEQILARLRTDGADWFLEDELHEADDEPSSDLSEAPDMSDEPGVSDEADEPELHDEDE